MSASRCDRALFCMNVSACAIQFNETLVERHIRTHDAASSRSRAVISSVVTPGPSPEQIPFGHHAMAEGHAVVPRTSRVRPTSSGVESSHVATDTSHIGSFSSSSLELSDLIPGPGNIQGNPILPASQFERPTGVSLPTLLEDRNAVARPDSTLSTASTSSTLSASSIVNSDGAYEVLNTAFKERFVSRDDVVHSEIPASFLQDMVKLTGMSESKIREWWSKKSKNPRSGSTFKGCGRGCGARLSHAEKKVLDSFYVQFDGASSYPTDEQITEINSYLESPLTKSRIKSWWGCKRFRGKKTTDVTEQAAKRQRETPLLYEDVTPTTISAAPQQSPRLGSFPCHDPYMSSFDASSYHYDGSTLSPLVNPGTREGADIDDMMIMPPQPQHGEEEMRREPRKTRIDIDNIYENVEKLLIMKNMRPSQIFHHA